MRERLRKSLGNNGRFASNVHGGEVPRLKLEAQKEVEGEQVKIELSDEIEEDIDLWEELAKVVAKFILRGFFIVIFAEVEEKEKILLLGNWFVDNHPLYMQLWFPHFDPISLALYDSPIWIHVYNLLIEYWGESSLERIGITLGTLLETDEGLAKNDSYLNHMTKECRTFVRPATRWVLNPRRQELVEKVYTSSRKETIAPLGALVIKEPLGDKDREGGRDFSKKVGFSPIIMDIDRSKASNNAQDAWMGLSDTKVDYDIRSKEEFDNEEESDNEDELDIIDSRSISQLANALLGRSKGNRGTRSNKKRHEDRAKEKGIINVVNFFRRSKGEDKMRVWKELSERISIIGKDWLVVAGDFNTI
ncbi:hypothetical protein SUGI_1260830 [Cryptomeria japonica]|uniref:DUF4283 domain-containing protein n=1 Tax=Cryptomeria japonica TaxID=3369 RepID=A0AAD3NK30_CRYJA|nr:hypothetical protein SUGI_1260830 [Cryptomeria japonica]